MGGGRGGHVLAWQAAEQVPRVSGRGRSGRRRGEGAGGAGEAGDAEEGGDGQHDTVVEEMHVHNRERSKCVDCRGDSICERSRRSSCKDCGVASICEHNRERSKCADQACDDDDVFYLFLHKQKIGAELHIYLEGGTYHKRLFRGPNSNDMKK